MSTNTLFWVGYVAMTLSLVFALLSFEAYPFGARRRYKRVALYAGAVTLLSWALIVGIRVVA